MKKPILDACCGSRMFWFDKEHPMVVFADIRKVDLDLNHGNRTCHIRPDKVQDFRKMEFPTDSFTLVVFDPPHLKGAGNNGYMAKKYGSLNKDWPTDLKAGFDECMRVLKPYGTLIFKWNEHSIKVSEVIKIFGREPLFGHRDASDQQNDMDGLHEIPDRGVRKKMVCPKCHCVDCICKLTVDGLLVENAAHKDLIKMLREDLDRTIKGRDEWFEKYTDAIRKAKG